MEVDLAIQKVSNHLIYALVDPDTLETHFIGQSAAGVARARVHSKDFYLETCENTPKNAWIQGLKAQGKEYLIKVLEQLPDAKGLNNAEAKWIKHYTAQGAKLFNVEDVVYWATKTYTPKADTTQPQPIFASNDLLPLDTSPIPEGTIKVGTLRQRLKVRPEVKKDAKYYRKLRTAYRNHHVKPFKDQFDQMYLTTYEAHIKTDLPIRYISLCLLGHKGIVGGFMFRYLDGSTVYDRSKRTNYIFRDDEAKAKISAAMSGKGPQPKSMVTVISALMTSGTWRPIVASNGKVYGSAVELAREYGGKPGAVCGALSGLRSNVMSLRVRLLTQEEIDRGYVYESDVPAPMKRKDLAPIVINRLKKRNLPLPEE